MLMKRLVLIFLLGSQLIFPLFKAAAQNQAEDFGNQVKCSITIKSTAWSRGKPAYVLIQLENIAGEDIKFWAKYYFNLESVEAEAASRGYGRLGDGYWSPSGMLTKNGQLVLVPNDLKNMIRIDHSTSRFPNEKIYLRKGESKQIKADLTQFRWADRVASYWPAENFFDLIPKGRYWLTFEVGVSGKKSSVSNRVEVKVD